MTGEIKHISKSLEWPPVSGRTIPKMYVIDFPELYKGTEH